MEHVFDSMLNYRDCVCTGGVSVLAYLSAHTHLCERKFALIADIAKIVATPY